MLHFQFGCPALFEQPRSSKLRWTKWWQRMADRRHVCQWHCASWMYGSVHKKEFGWLGCFLSPRRLSRVCSRDHEHVPIQGKYTKDSAIYVQGLAFEIALSFQEALGRCSDHSKWRPALESVITNDLLASSSWTAKSVIPWSSQSHINVLELAAYGVLVRDLSRSSPDSRFSVFLDSQVAKSAAAKGRSTSLALSPGLGRISPACLWPLSFVGVFSHSPQPCR